MLKIGYLLRSFCIMERTELLAYLDFSQEHKCILEFRNVSGKVSKIRVNGYKEAGSNGTRREKRRGARTYGDSPVASAFQDRFDGGGVRKENR